MQQDRAWQSIDDIVSHEQLKNGHYEWTSRHGVYRAMISPRGVQVGRKEGDEWVLDLGIDTVLKLFRNMKGPSVTGARWRA